MLGLPSDVDIEGNCSPTLVEPAAVKEVLLVAL